MIAYTMATGRGDTDLLLSGLAQELAARGLLGAGTVQINTEREDSHPCDMDVKVLPDGPILRISQSLGQNAKGCRLDPSALEAAVALVEERLRSGVDYLIVNKFGKHEAEGRGFRAAIAEAVSLGIPVLVGLNALNREAFEEFSAGMAVHLAPDRQVLSAWLYEALSDEQLIAS